MRLKPFARTMRFALFLLGAGLGLLGRGRRLRRGRQDGALACRQRSLSSDAAGFQPAPSLSEGGYGGRIRRDPRPRRQDSNSGRPDRRRSTELKVPPFLATQMTNFWSQAWSERNRVVASASRPLGWNDIGMAVNSRRGRSQDQLHIHVDCVDPRLKQALASRAGRLSSKWSSLEPGPWAGRYRVKEIDAAGVDRNIFKLVADEIPGAKSKMARQSIAVVGFIGPKRKSRLRRAGQ